ncbi:hypothetical protein FGO68_gene8948 [Halteria grandinella]|uniref:Uncharacterized protein n=1 Tax=Halteria grandinella TaxID=5974 RepID=A0A8J8NFA8_HALGN|nr:hypothetical protein FGO68_gene8948 [Halteria grandinella]
MKMHNTHSSSLAKGASQSSSALLVSGLTGLSLVQSAQGGARGKHLNLIKEEDAPNENTIPFDSSMSGGNNEDVSPKLGGNGGAGNRRNHTGGLPISNSQHARQPPVSSSLQNYVMKRPAINVANLEQQQMNNPFGAAGGGAFIKTTMSLGNNSAIPRHPHSHNKGGSMEAETPKLIGSSTTQVNESQKTRITIKNHQRKRSSFGLDEGSIATPTTEVLYRKNNQGMSGGPQIIGQRRGTLLSMTGVLPGMEYLQATTPSRRLNGKPLNTSPNKTGMPKDSNTIVDQEYVLRELGKKDKMFLALLNVKKQMAQQANQPQVARQNTKFTTSLTQGGSAPQIPFIPNPNQPLLRVYTVVEADPNFRVQQEMSTLKVHYDPSNQNIQPKFGLSDTKIEKLVQAVFRDSDLDESSDDSDDQDEYASDHGGDTGKMGGLAHLEADDSMVSKSIDNGGGLMVKSREDSIDRSANPSPTSS